MSQQPRQALPTPHGFVWTFPSIVVRVHDGDTVVCHIKVHPNEGGDLYEVNVRVEGINAPELNTAAGVVARDYAASLLPAGMAVTIVATKREKYGRFLGRIILPNGDDLSALLLAGGYAVPFMT